MAEINIMTTPMTEVEPATVQKFTSSLYGEAIYPNDDRYKSARSVFNGMIDKQPGLIVRCAGTCDVINAVNFARTHNLLVAVRGGGHSIAGKSVCDNGLLIDLSAMKGMRVDPVSRTARAQPGLRLGQFDRETQAFGLATTLGVVSDTGIAGLTLGGGVGWLNGKHGLACDNLLSADVITADGQFVTASANQHDDLYWALRGGGGNFGIVTSFEYKLHLLGPVFAGMVVYELSKAKEVLRFFDDFSPGCPDELSTMAAILTGPDGKLVVAILACYSGALGAGEDALKAIRNFGPPLADLMQPMPYVQMQRLLDESFPVGRLHYWKSNFMRRLSDEAIETILEYTATMPSPTTGIVLQQVHGAASRVASSATAFPHRSEQYDFLIGSNWTDSTESDRNIAWTREFWAQMQAFVEDGVYVNNLGEEGEERVKAAYKQNYHRLLEVKQKYDPNNFFSLNQNIQQTGEAKANAGSWTPLV